MPLFRPETIGAQDRLYGDVLLAPPISWQIAGYFFLATIVAAAIFLSSASHSEFAIVSGRIVRGETRAPAASTRSEADKKPVSENGSIVAGDEPVALLDVPADIAGRIAPGQPVRIAIDAFPYQMFGTIDGRLSTLSRTTVSIHDRDGRQRDVFVASASLTRAAIMAFGRAQPLRAGMTVSARIETGRRSLLGWLFDPMRSAPRR